MANLAHALGRGREAEAASLLQNSLRVLEAELPRDAEETLTIRTQLASLHKDDRSRLHEAEDMLRRAVDGWGPERSKRSVSALIASLQLGSILGQRRDTSEEAMGFVAAAHQGFVGLLGPEHAHTKSAAARLADLLHATGRTTEADAINPSRGSILG
eukprot:gnl/TRDRNA2_/TRDRNA2_83837_c0_seq1.p1 gnl/TRDRNA2_/TRDRNA2_83837_c0~~gnl/TRDRNA2_/TRDRNA2_83837_c0_seq1.p1  ORF type:complete len:157 (+),score=33.51 gnl/TRDRNA2_/TRDRNA2_83837_c0_seq1:203-673(+)